ncbi:MAG TPA: hypothetical protein VHX88_08470 [Solirubrobacteraceae bacterium]|nr:hypothetical protein [Solirubrobacteraceae bacterium]
MQPLDRVEHLVIGTLGEQVDRPPAAEAALAAVQPDLGALARVDVAQLTGDVVKLCAMPSATVTVIHLKPLSSAACSR